MSTGILNIFVLYGDQWSPVLKVLTTNTGAHTNTHIRIHRHTLFTYTYVCILYIFVYILHPNIEIYIKCWVWVFFFHQMKSVFKVNVERLYLSPYNTVGQQFTKQIFGKLF